MYKTKVNVRVFSNKQELKLFLPVVFWLLINIINIILFVKIDFLTEKPFTIIIFLIYVICAFVSIIPSYIFMKRRLLKYKNNYVIKELTFYAKEKNLYLDDSKLSIIKSKKDGKIYLDDFIITHMHIPSKGYVNNNKVTFMGIIDKSYSDEFESFLKSNDINMAFCENKPKYF